MEGCDIQSGAFRNTVFQVTIALPGAGRTISFKYDPFGRRIENVSPSGTTIYVYDGDNIIEELNAEGSLGERYTYGPGTDEPLMGHRQPKVFYYEADGLGSVTSLTDPTGAVAATYTYDSFGFMTASTGSATNWFRYTGRQFDSTGGLYYYRARYYDPMSGRFLSEDPISFQGGINFYRYAVNNPIIFRDPSGLLVACFYVQNNGHMVCYDADSGDQVVNTTGYAGGNEGNNPEGVNNSAEQYVTDIGPLPQGFYNIGLDNGHMGVLSLPLTPILWPNMKQRGNFYIHGDTDCQCQDASKGCIVLPHDARKTINDSGGGSLYVAPNEDNVVWPSSAAGVLRSLGLLK